MNRRLHVAIKLTVCHPLICHSTLLAYASWADADPMERSCQVGARENSDPGLLP
jgi:hypothetical protein